MTDTEALFFEELSRIAPADEAAMRAAERRQAELAKPPGSLGKLEALSVRLAGITGEVYNRAEHRRLLVFAGDNGVCAEGVSSAPQSVTLTQSINLSMGRTGAGVLCRRFATEVEVYDVGIAAEVRGGRVIDRKLAFGTDNILYGPAMSRENALRALLIGMEAAKKAKRDGMDVIGIGEMGIGNTTTSSAMLAVLTGTPVSEVTGRGGGLTDEAYLRKLRVIEGAIAVNAPDADEPLDVLAKLGGYDLAAMAGAFLGAALCRLPVVIDGFISVVAALTAARLCPAAKDCMIASHASYEIGYRIACRELGLAPMLALDMRLGEGSGCPLAFEILSAACTVIREMTTFSDGGIDDSYLDPIRACDSFTVEGRDER